MLLGKMGPDHETDAPWKFGLDPSLSPDYARPWLYAGLWPEPNQSQFEDSRWHCADTEQTLEQQSQIHGGHSIYELYDSFNGWDEQFSVDDKDRAIEDERAEGYVAQEPPITPADFWRPHKRY